MPNPNYIFPLEEHNDQRRLPAAHNPGAVRRRDLQHDNVSVVHSGESDPQPNEDAQDAISDAEETRHD